MSAGLVEDNAAKTVAYYNGHNAAGAVIRLQHGNGGACRLRADSLRIEAVEKLRTAQRTRAEISRLLFRVAACHRIDGDPRSCPLVSFAKSLGIGDKHPLHAVRAAHRGLRNKGRVAPCGLVGQLKLLYCRLFVGLFRRNNYFMRCFALIRIYYAHGLPAFFAAARSRIPCHFQQVFPVGIVCIDINDPLAIEKTQTHAVIYTARCLFYPAVYKADAVFCVMLRKNFRKIRTLVHSKGKNIVCKIYVKHFTPPFLLFLPSKLYIISRRKSTE